MIKICSLCRVEKPLDEFYNYKGGRFGKTSQCKLCHNASLERSHARKAGLLPPLEPKTRATKPLYESGGDYTCIRCNETKPFSAFRRTKIYSRLTIGSYCRDCHKAVSIINLQKQRAADPKTAWARGSYHSSLSRAKLKGLAHTLTIPEILEIATPSRCVYCDYEPIFTRTKALDRRTAPSLDRLCPAKGYIKSNVVFSCLRCNMIKNEAAPEDLKRIYERTVALLAAREAPARADTPQATEATQPEVGDLPTRSEPHIM